MHLLTIVKLAHLIGLIMGLGGAMLADYTTLTRGVLRPVSPYTIHQVEFLSRAVSAGLSILWISGLALIWINTSEHPEYVTNQKLWAKVIVVCILTINGFAVHRAVLPQLRDALGHRLFDGAANSDVLMMTLIGSFSFVSWTMPFVLAKASELNYVTPVENILAVYALCILLVWLGLFTVMSSISKLQEIARRVATMTLQPNAAWEETAPRLAA